MVEIPLCGISSFIITFYLLFLIYLKFLLIAYYLIEGRRVWMECKSGEFIRRYIQEHGISLLSVAAGTGIKYELLRRSINGKGRKLGADEFLKVLECLGFKVKAENEQEVFLLV